MEYKNKNPYKIVFLYVGVPMLGGHLVVLAWWRYKKAFKKEWYLKDLSRYFCRADPILFLFSGCWCIVKSYDPIIIFFEMAWLIIKKFEWQAASSTTSIKEFLYWCISFMTLHGLLDRVQLLGNLKTHTCINPVK